MDALKWVISSSRLQYLFILCLLILDSFHHNHLAKANWCSSDFTSYAEICGLVRRQYACIYCKFWFTLRKKTFKIVLFDISFLSVVTFLAGILSSVSHKGCLWRVWTGYLPSQSSIRNNDLIEHRNNEAKFLCNKCTDLCDLFRIIMLNFVQFG